MQQIADIQLRQTLTQTSRAVRNAYFDLVNAIAGLQVAQQSLELAQTSLRNNQRRVEVGTMAPIDIVQAEAEVAANEEAVIVAEGQIRTAEDRLRTLVMNPSQPDFWTTRLEPSEQPTLAPQPVDVDAAIANALANRTDLAQAAQAIEQTDIGLKYTAQPEAAGARRDGDLRPGRHRRHAAAVRPGSGDRRAVRRSTSRSAASATRCGTCSATSSGRGACS